MTDETVTRDEGGTRGGDAPRDEHGTRRDDSPHDEGKPRKDGTPLEDGAPLEDGTPRQEVHPARLVLTLGIAGVLTGMLLVGTHQATAPTIAAYKQRMLEAAVHEVLGGPERFDVLYVSGGALTAEAPAGVDAGDVERVYLGYDDAGRRLGYAIAAGEPGFQDVVRLIFGYDPATDRLLGMKVLESKETPGLGDKIEKDAAFVSQFRGVQAPLVGVKAGRGTGDDPSEVDMITGATISSWAVIDIINHALERLGPALDGHDVEVDA